VTTFSTSSSAFLGDGFQITADGITALRLRGNLEAVIQSSNVAGSGFHCAFGIGIVNLTAFNVGATAVMRPLTDADWDGWFYHRFFDLHVGDQTAGDIQERPVQFEVDSKAMRKLKQDDVIYAMLEVVETGIAEIDVFFDSRMLFALA